MVSLLLLLPLAAQSPAPAAEIRPQQVAWAELRGRGFDGGWEFPRQRPDGSPYPGVEFEEALFSLARRPLVPARGERPAIWLGDLVRELQAAGWSKEANEAAYESVEEALSKEDRERLRHLLRAEDLYTSKWNPRKSGQRHGMHFGKSWKFGKHDWPEARADREVEQIAQIVVADLASIKTAEADYAGYWAHHKHDWRRIEVQRDSLLQVRGDGGELLASSLDIEFEFDLPWPFSTAEFRLHTLNRFLADGRPILYLHGTGSDLHWLAGYDVYEPIRDRTGAQVGTMMVRIFGLDLDGVPDGRGDRHDNLRGQFGNLRRDAERLFRERAATASDPAATPAPAGLPEAPVIDGRRVAS